MGVSHDVQQYIAVKVLYVHGSWLSSF